MTAIAVLIDISGYPPPKVARREKFCFPSCSSAACSVPDAPRKVHPSVQDAGYIHGPVGHRIDHHVLFNIESPVTFGEVEPSVPKAGVVGDRLESLMEGVSVDLPLPLSMGFIGVLQDALNVRLGLTGEAQCIAFRGGHRDCRSSCPAWRVARRVVRSAP